MRSQSADCDTESIKGGVNEAAAVPHTSPSHGSYHWTMERLISLGLVPLTIAPFVGGSLNPIMDGLLCASILVHSHIGFQYVGRAGSHLSHVTDPVLQSFHHRLLPILACAQHPKGIDVVAQCRHSSGGRRLLRVRDQRRGIDRGY